METIYQTYTRTVCINCKNKKSCSEELRIRIDNSIKCNRYEKEETQKAKKKQPANWQRW